MNSKKTAFVLLVSLFLAVTGRVTSANGQAAENECDAEDVGTVINCLRIKSIRLESQVDRVYSARRETLEKRKRSKEKLERDVASEIDRRLVDSQNAWNRFAESECSLLGSEFLGGTYEGLLYFDCRVKKAEARLQVLRNLYVK